MDQSSKWVRGKILNEFSLGKYNFTEAVYKPGASLPSHSHDFFYFRYVLAGEFTEYFGRDSFLFKPATMMLRCNDEPHSNKFHTSTRSLTIRLNPSHFRRITAHRKFLNDTSIYNNKLTSELVTRLYKELYLMDEFSELTIEGLMLETIALAFRGASDRTYGSPPEWLLKAKESIDEEFQQNTSIDSLAKISGVHSTHLVGEFRRFFGTTIGDYVRLKRVAYAQEKLISSRVPISELALMAGFFDQSHFTRVFKKAVGMTPAIYRSSFRSH